ncbi:MAG: AraC family transcriptional regulator [Spirochaetes bacterium]|nr:AraC family transcriptional regulator [Spirochaetota bacterium]
MYVLKIVFLVGSIQGFITSLALFSFGKTHRKANYYLATSVLVMTGILLVDYFFHGNEPFRFLKHSDFHAVLSFLLGPLLYLYVKSLTGLGTPKKSAVILYFTPFISVLLFMGVYIASGFLPQVYQYFFIIEICSLLYVLSFIILSILGIQRYERAIRDSFSNLDKVSLQWLRVIEIVLATIILAAAVLYFWKSYFDMVWILVALMIYIISYYTLRKPDIFSGTVAEEGVKKYQKSSLNSKILQDNKMKIDKIMKEEKVYMDSEITLPMLAEKLSLPVHHLSQIINQAYNKSFYEFISLYRIEQAKELILSSKDEDIRIMNICFQVGFNTISSFNKSFKKFTGLTPTQFRNKKHHS